MREMTYSSPKQNKKGLLALALSFALLLLSIAVFYQQMSYRWLSQLAVYITGGTVIWISVRYFFSAYTYEVACFEGEWLLIVTVRQGKRTTTLCRMPLHQLVSVTPLLSPRDIKGTRDKKAERHRFHQNAFPDLLCSATFLTEDKSVTVEMETDETFCKNLSAFVNPILTIHHDCEENENAGNS